MWILLFVFGAIAAMGSVQCAFGQAEMHHEHENIGWVPREILEKPVSIRQGIGNLHEQVTTKSPEAQAFYDQGLNYLHSYDWIEAARAFNQSLRLDPKIAMAWVGLADVYIQLQDNSAAKAACEHAKSLADQAREGEQTRVSITAAQLDFLEDSSAGSMQRYFAWRKMISDALAAAPTDPWLWILRGLADEGNPAPMGQGGGIDTVAFYETALAYSPDNSAAHHFLAHTFENLGRTQDALVQAEAYVRLAPAIPHAHHMRGHELRRLGRTAEAIEEFRKAGELEEAYYKTENIPALYDWHRAHNLALLALCYETLGQMKAAETPLREMFSLPGRTDIAEFNRREWPDFLLDSGHAEEALQTAHTMISNSHWAMGKFAGHAVAGRAYLAMNRIDDAKAELDAAEREMENVPSSAIGQLPNASILRAEIALREHKFESADESLKKVEATLRSMPGPDSWSESLFELQSIARAAEQSGDWPLVEYTGRQIIEHDPSYAGGYYVAGLVAEHAGDASLAQSQFQKAEKLWAGADPNLPELVAMRRKVSASN
jgi:tetratricopeptide (TPR) repeat protein